MIRKLFPPRYHCYPPSLRYCGRAAVLRALCSNNILIMIQPVNCEQCFQGFNFNYLFITSVCLLIVSHVVSAFYWGICLKNGKQVVIECLCLADKIVMSWNLRFFDVKEASLLRNQDCASTFLSSPLRFQFSCFAAVLRSALPWREARCFPLRFGTPLIKRTWHWLGWPMMSKL